MPEPPADAVTIEVSGLTDQETREVFQAKFDAHRNEFANGSSFVFTGSGDTYAYRIWPITNVQNFADRIDFAKVINVAPKSISLKANPLTAAERRPKTGPGHELDGILFDLNSKLVTKQKEALRSLGLMPPNDRREEIAKAIEPLLLGNDIFLKAETAKALGVWGSKENTKALVSALTDTQGNVRGAAIEALRAIKHPSCAEAVAFLLTTGERGAASETLKALGSEAEPAVLKYLDSTDLFTRTEVCKILKEIGTEACVAPLQDLFRRVNGFGFDADAAKETLFSPDASITPQGKRAQKKGHQ